MDAVSFVIPGEPVAWARARLMGIRHFTPGKQRSHQAGVATIAANAMQGRAPLVGPVMLKVEATWLRPKSASKRKPPVWKATKPDADNIAKQVGDAINKIVFVDDAQVAFVSVSKRYGEIAETRVTVCPLEGAL
jgi:Holliday junction resolvase RusA-like endonuclease